MELEKGVITVHHILLSYAVRSFMSCFIPRHFELDFNVPTADVTNDNKNNKLCLQPLWLLLSDVGRFFIKRRGVILSYREYSSFVVVLFEVYSSFPRSASSAVY